MNNINWEILVNHLTGQASEAEERELARWLAEAPDHKDLLERLKKMWNAAPSAPDRIDTEKALRQVLSRIEGAPLVSRRTDRRTPIFAFRRPISEVIARPFILRAAAVLMIAVGVYAAYHVLTSRTDEETASVKFAGMQTLELGDGTRITFDVGSSFTYPRTFEDATSREVSLDGEAYFEVARDVERPFIVHAHGGTIRVLGTSFAVRSWKSDGHIVVAVKEGRVALQPEATDDTGKAVELTDNTMSRLSRTLRTPSPPEKIEFGSFVSWMKKETYFQDTPVPEVLRQIERWYNVSFQFTDSAITRENVTIFLANKPLKENLELLSIILNVRAEQHGDTVRILSH